MSTVYDALMGATLAFILSAHMFSSKKLALAGLVAAFAALLVAVLA